MMRAVSLIVGSMPAVHIRIVKTHVRPGVPIGTAVVARLIVSVIPGVDETATYGCRQCDTGDEKKLFHTAPPVKVACSSVFLR
jgi:hypothetical protein